MNIVLLGAPGSGKGTQAKYIAEKFGVIHLSTGDVFRDAIKAESPLGKEIKSYVESGKLVPDELVSKVVFEKLTGLKGKAGFLLDGYPRTLGQAESMAEFIKAQGIALNAILFFDVPFDELTKRLSARRQCPSCKEVYNLVQKPPKAANKCDKCGAGLIHRKDDQPEVVSDRLKVYSKETEPILSFYQRHPGYRRIDAARNIEQVNADIQAVLKSN
jgi:adenylate kinase